ncbi:MAG: YhbY family RNA-binding protein [Gammaproteobacteria bacterium]|nr:YhbY family RNA-binding protein [Gammaproteobacteria bacterium]
MPLTADRKKALRALGHNLKPIVTIADKGLSTNVCAELERALRDHELIKIKLAIVDRQLRHQLVGEICTLHGAELVQQIGKVALVLRKADKPNHKLSNLLP